MIRTIGLSQWILLITGAFCILTPGRVAKLLPYLVGGSMAFLGGFSIADWNRDWKKIFAATGLAYGLVLLIIGVSFVFQGPKALFSMGIVWPLVIEFCVRVLLALLLLFDLHGKFTPHLRILGAELIAACLGPAISSRRQSSVMQQYSQTERCDERKDENDDT